MFHVPSISLRVILKGTNTQKTHTRKDRRTNERSESVKEVKGTRKDRGDGNLSFFLKDKDAQVVRW